MLPSQANRKRPLAHLPTPKDLARIFKKPRRDHPELLETSGPPRALGIPPVPPLGTDLPPAAHSVPRSAVPVLKPPYRAADFFADHGPRLDRGAQRQFAAAVRCYPPPRAPFFALAEPVSRPGVMVPFVFPPLPECRADPLTNMPDTPDGEPARPVMAPLPFPPPNYMPYPLISEKAPPTPHEVFGAWLDALGRLPRVDMVVASAAGSIFDLHAEAGAAGLSAARLQELVRLGQVAESDPEASDDRSEASDSSDSLDALQSSYRRFMDYYSNIDVSTEHARHAARRPSNVVVVRSDLRNDYTNVRTKDTQAGKVLQAEPRCVPLAFTMDPRERDAEPPATLPAPAAAEDVTDANEENTERRREHLVQSYSVLEDHFAQNRDQLYASRKQQLLERLRQLRTSEIHFDTTKNKINNDDLRRYHDRRQTEKDEQLLSLRLSLNYEKLKNALSFYQTSHRLYKTMNLVMINKLQKIKNFLDHQKQVLDDHSGGSGDTDAVNIRNRDIAKFYESFVEQDYSNEIKEVFRAAIAKDDGLDKDDPYTLDPALFRKVYKGHQHTANVHDFMPLVTREEFRLITGEAPSKLGPAKDPNSKSKGGRHQIFQSSLYDRVTSGSDTNASENGMVLKRRPGRRAAPKPTYGEEVAKNSNDTALVAKIMKQFIGPSAANAQELTEDLDLIGIQTKWPVK
ncbi:hypothetical protein METBIDRAFT_178734 [Metschnikowia bicuspidata var. bicuspidata NRRL YB-4993]|uniref:Uncharacterized protein n=1 Tax=Metschnikowia bicuspidata var. bicuspidata NRRL YB-4993 TaxID=869754 RepID=A0A1A0HAW5_9ASCO|nr:hypothetical protein METBIDRAFT_178734 [Metschnikowia bicuspidata var. bicuspidata NRRL YB-4993]OBA21264.1 hypothetical protein METBIDRAFT_178734 [Metschnikowia bicuspidata var. bicuspidata NRRL YB-4993]